MKRLISFLHSRFFNTSLTIAAFVFSAFIISWLVYRQWDVIVQTQWKINLGAIPLSFLIYSICMSIVVFIWVRIMRSFGVEIQYFSHFRTYFVGHLTRRLPGTIWYVAYRARSYKKSGFPAGLTTLASGIELAIMVLSALIVSMLFAIPLLDRYQASLWGGIILTGLCIIFLQPRVINRLLSRFGGKTDWFDYAKILQWTSGFVIVWLFSGILLFAIGNILIPIGWENLGIVIGSNALIGLLSQVLILSPSNFGFTELGLSLLLSSFLPSPIAVIVALANRILVTLFDTIWALISLAAERFARLEKK